MALPDGRLGPAAPSSLEGLSDATASARLQTDGPNELPSSKPKSNLRIVVEVFREPMFLLLAATGLVYLLLGGIEEAAALIVAIGLVIGITVFQERKTERSLEALRDLSSPRALVLRAGRRQRIAGRDVVRGDLLALAEGDRVPADALVLSGLSGFPPIRNRGGVEPEPGLPL